jgi:hypothetical protein
MTTIAGLAPKRNRWAIPSLILAVLADFVLIPLSALNAFGFPYRLVQDGQAIAIWWAATSCVGLLCHAMLAASLMMGVAAVVQIRFRKGEEGGAGLTLAAVVLALGGLLLPSLIRVCSWLVQVVRMSM